MNEEQSSYLFKTEKITYFPPTMPPKKIFTKSNFSGVSDRDILLRLRAANSVLRNCETERQSWQDRIEDENYRIMELVLEQSKRAHAKKEK